MEANSWGRSGGRAVGREVQGSLGFSALARNQLDADVGLPLLRAARDQLSTATIVRNSLGKVRPQPIVEGLAEVGQCVDGGKHGREREGGVLIAMKIDRQAPAVAKPTFLSVNAQGLQLLERVIEGR